MLLVQDQNNVGMCLTMKVLGFGGYGTSSTWRTTHSKALLGTRGFQDLWFSGPDWTCMGLLFSMLLLAVCVVKNRVLLLSQTSA